MLLGNEFIPHLSALTLCDGCMYAHKHASKKYNCPFCRALVSSSNKERFRLTKKRMDCGDSDAFVMMGSVYYQGTKEVKRDFEKATELWHKAVDLESDLAHYYLGVAYANGQGVEKDEDKSLYHYRRAAISGVLVARYIMGHLANKSEKTMVAVKHFVIAAEAGHDDSLSCLKKCYEQGAVKKDVFEKAVRAHKVACDEQKSDDRVAAAEERKRMGLLGRV